MGRSQAKIYQQRIDVLTKSLSSIQQKHFVLSFSRLLVFACSLVSWIWLYPVFSWLGASVGAAFLIVFFVFIKWHKRVEDKRGYLLKLLEINQLELKSCLGDFSGSDGGNGFIDVGHVYSYDIDLFGPGSLFQFLNRTVTQGGKKLLAFWLKETPLPTQIILKQQQSIEELAPDVEFRQSFGAFGRLYPTGENEKEIIEKWLTQPSFFKSKRVFAALLWLWPLLNFTVLALVIGNWVNWTVFIYLMIFNLGCVGVGLKEFNKRYALLSSGHLQLKKMLQLMKLIENIKPQASLTQELHQKLFKNALPVSKQIQQLTTLLDALDNRNNILIGILLNSLLFWDWQCLWRIEKWQRTHQMDFEEWQKTVAYFDALMSLANFRFNHPEYIFPLLADECFEFTAEELGHPLLDEETRVCNHFNIDDSQRYTIITGANMAGKSTFLRTIASNLVLAGCGAPVCATKMVFTPLPLFTSMRTEDSLMKHESYFFAELKRLQRIAQELDKGEKLFIILDEILRGTNSEDKRKGSIGFVKKITRKNAYGLVATHDLELARLAEQQPQVFKALCFEVAIKNNELQFDYKLQPGVTKNMNASFLMERMGIID
ncbi:MAG TPA: hypothetical protein DCQ26_05210 [Marinilabiliales bacterium]|jgi:hypothetical protein|nr:MAG: hypothetical protein A2W95_11215 [Bacteroidetes bacterium GWA2_40_14]OFX60718.1 MAG: hypothetical protein A2W84_09410 [Bacteroidetes bacterium GWC2_40_13]OFX73927.1 MAG: hypothetical protein A2W96_11440 [Bacteroidetes bacterium GWD2_40_43]OFX93239.1 MAG: hypothetical protein A2W97_06630 [Bacteroidetes bacterium GWE2_40_63]OFY17699.1 MAG: hypothetical protein A2W88_00920 [Bacteroidetes bacterium GWF2_40_13]OFZ24261.1 MAG: hypothetical protein A2437_17765 [Bacteroidetes bacterium RIFOXYC